ncbi:unnamed protein product [Adineta steineri]|uniref:DUF5672 domain-containing protein n=1 Tax=Adineta steineri TaxID=433720 RepID=A0A815AWH4_9BILA|nr:unnamed protein product [Adineta steineri]
MNTNYNQSKTNTLLTDEKFWKQIPDEKILLFQIDSIMCSNSTHKITDYLQYDFIGAPWNLIWYPFNKTYLVGNGGFLLRSRSKILALLQLIQYDSFPPDDHPFNKTYLVGNGGFSLRSRSKILALLQLIQYDSFPPEDVWYAQNLHRVNASIAPVHIAKTFAVESVFYERPVGVHRFTWGCKFRRKISETCPESVMVLPNGGC